MKDYSAIYIGVVLFLVFLALNNHCILISFVSLCHHFHFLSVKLHSDKIDSTVFTAFGYYHSMHAGLCVCYIRKSQSE